MGSGTPHNATMPQRSRLLNKPRRCHHPSPILYDDDQPGPGPGPGTSSLSRPAWVIRSLRWARLTQRLALSYFTTICRAALSWIVYVFYICLHIYLSSGKYNTSRGLSGPGPAEHSSDLVRYFLISWEQMIYNELCSIQTNQVLIHFISDNLWSLQCNKWSSFLYLTLKLNISIARSAELSCG